MTRFLTFLPVFCVIGLMTALTACAPTLNTRGNFLEPTRLQGFTNGVTSQQEITQKLGSPTATDPFNKNTWFYIGEKTETKAFFMPDVTARRVIKVEFDDTGMLKNMAEVDEKSGKDVAMVGKTTQSGGQKMNVFQQFISNLGKFNTNQMNTGNGGNPGR